MITPLNHIAGVRNGKVLPLLVFLLPCLFAITGLLVDGSSVLSTQNRLQNAIDSAALAAALELNAGSTTAEAQAAGELLMQRNGFSQASLEFQFDQSSANAGQVDSVTATATDSKSLYIMPIFNQSTKLVAAASTAGFLPEKHRAAIVVLEANPPELSYGSVADLLKSSSLSPLINSSSYQLGLADLLQPIGVLGGTLSNLLNSNLVSAINTQLVSTLDQTLQSTHLAMPLALVAGFEVEGLGRLTVDGAIHVNTQWGGVDQRGDPVGNALPPHALSCMPLLSTTRLIAPTIRVVGGVESPNNYLPLSSTASSPLKAGVLPVPDPLEGVTLPSPMGNSNGHKIVIALPTSLVSNVIQNSLGILPLPLRSLAATLLSPVLNLLSASTINPGRYDSLTILSLGGSVTLSPGVYEITGVNPVTQISLTIVGPVQAQGASYAIKLSSANEFLGLPGVGELLPSCAVLPLLPGGRMSPNQNAHNILIYQAPNDRRPMVIESLGLLSGHRISGTIYAKRGHLTLLLNGGEHDLAIAVGTLRIATVLDSRVTPSHLLPAATNVSLLR